MTPETVCRLVEYIPETGELFWRSRDPCAFRAPGGGAWWNNRYAGKPAFTATNAHGYLHGSIFKKTLLAHRVAWCVAIGVWPDGEIDHINGDKTDNRIVNLRDVSRRENARNLSLNRRNTSGVLGVYQMPSGNWQAELNTGDERIRQTFPTFLDAVQARKRLEAEKNFHPYHGKGAV